MSARQDRSDDCEQGDQRLAISSTATAGRMDILVPVSACLRLLVSATELELHQRNQPRAAH